MELEAYLRKIEEIRRRFIGRLEATIGRLKVLSENQDRESLTEIRRSLHELAGTAPTLGLDDIGARARQIETIVAEALATSRLLDDTETERLRAGIQDLADHAQKAREALT